MKNTIYAIGDKDVSNRPLFSDTLRERLFHGSSMLEMNKTAAVAVGIISAGLVQLAQVTFGKDFSVEVFAFSSLGGISGIGLYNFAKGFIQNKITFDDDSPGEKVMDEKYSAPEPALSAKKLKV